MWESDGAVGRRSLRLGGKPRRTRFGVVRYNEGASGLLVIPEGVAQIGQWVRYVRTPGGFAFRFGDSGEYPVRRRNSTSRSLMAVLPMELAGFAKETITDLEISPVEGGWEVLLPEGA